MALFRDDCAANPETKTTVAALSISVSPSTLLDDARKAYAEDKELLRLMDYFANSSRKFLSDLAALYRSSLNRLTTRNGLLYYTVVADDTPHVFILDNDDLRLRIMF